MSTFFTPLADHLVREDRGTLAKVMPVTACTGASGQNERKHLARQFHIECLVTCHAKSNFAFSASTSIHECLMVCRRRPNGKTPPTKVVVLTRNPTTADEVAELVEAIRGQGDLSSWGSKYEWDATRIAEGDWTPVQWFDPILAEAARDLELNHGLEPVGFRYEVGPDSKRRIPDAFEKCQIRDEGAVPTFHSASNKLRRTIQGESEAWFRPKSGKESLAAKYWAQNGQMMVAIRLDTISGRLTGLWSPQPSIGVQWVPVAVPEQPKAKALATWWNTTPVRLMLLNRRSKKLTYPTWQLAHLREMRIPRPDNPAWPALKSAFDLTCDEELLPMRQATECAVREIIDEAAAKAIGVDPAVIADWRTRLAREPTVGA